MSVGLSIPKSNPYYGFITARAEELEMHPDDYLASLLIPALDEEAEEIGFPL